MLRVGIGRADDNAPEAGLDNGVGAWRGSTMGATGLKGNIKGCAARVVAML